MVFSHVKSAPYKSLLHGSHSLVRAPRPHTFCGNFINCSFASEAASLNYQFVLLFFFHGDKEAGELSKRMAQNKDAYRKRLRINLLLFSGRNPGLSCTYLLVLSRNLVKRFFTGHQIL